MYKISPQLVQEVLNYMVNKPFVEVNQLINALPKLEEFKEDPKSEQK